MERCTFLTASLLLAAAGLWAQNPIRVNSARELVKALSSERTVLLAPGEYLVSEASRVATAVASWEQTFDGPQLVISGVNRLTLKAEQGATLLASPRYAYTLVFRNCQDLRLVGLTLGHTEAGECDGGVLQLERCSGVRIEECDLFGSGVLGLDLQECARVTVFDSTIRECTLGALYAVGTEDLRLQHMQITHNEAWPLISLDACRRVVLESCRIAGNVGDGLFWIDPGSQEVSLPRTTISGLTVEALLYEGSLIPDFSETIFVENRFGDPQEEPEEYGDEEGNYEDNYDEEYDSQ